MPPSVSWLHPFLTPLPHLPGLSGASRLLVHVARVTRDVCLGGASAGLGTIAMQLPGGSTDSGTAFRASKLAKTRARVWGESSHRVRAPWVSPRASGANTHTLGQYLFPLHVWCPRPKCLGIRSLGHEATQHLRRWWRCVLGPGFRGMCDWVECIGSQAMRGFQW